SPDSGLTIGATEDAAACRPARPDDTDHVSPRPPTTRAYGGGPKTPSEIERAKMLSAHRWRYACSIDSCSNTIPVGPVRSTPGKRDVMFAIEEERNSTSMRYDAATG